MVVNVMNYGYFDVYNEFMMDLLFEFVYIEIVNMVGKVEID